MGFGFDFNIDPLSAIGGLFTNSANVKQSKWATHRSIEEGYRNREFQETMYNSRHQRTAEDLRKAGLNPILAVGSAGSAPGGAQGQAQAAQLENPLEGAVSNAIQAKKIKSLVERQQNEIQNIQADTRKKRMETKKIEKDAAVSGIWVDVINSAKEMYKKQGEFNKRAKEHFEKQFKPRGGGLR